MPRAFSIALPSAAGESATLIPADFMASILSWAPPLPPEMIVLGERPGTAEWLALLLVIAALAAVMLPERRAKTPPPAAATVHPD